MKEKENNKKVEEDKKTEEETEDKIVCQWLNEERLIIDSDGQVTPCCYVSNPLYLYLHDPDSVWIFQDPYKTKLGLPYNEVMQEYVDDIEDFNVFEHTLEEILSTKWFTKTLPESWEDPNKAMDVCKQFCTVKCSKKDKEKSNDDE